MGNLAAAIIARPTTRRRFFGVLNLVLGSLAVSYALPAGRARAAEQAARKWVCTNADCDPFVYDPAVGDADNIAHPGHPIPAGVAFEDLPHDWQCPFCGSGKNFFRPLDA
ncbi:MAG: rubredoxin [Caenispirillum bisanense]|nr:rubredoxin [Caenispirillum bisanense]MCA1972547.1 rubredoxin [Caenispirillum sp.]